MKITLLKGSFAAKDLENIITEMIRIKIKYHEEKIKNCDEEETIKMRENRIIKLQNELKDLRSFLSSASTDIINADAEIEISKS
ncbi:hypothetical protein EHQ82_05345 [Leptospira selangorensis]|uniref:Uncharacterized protein n=1 Tax=Leptospira selangorensis TaxID=2484982 RepID=A0ABY2NGF9_9LEPT|nr:hypothetical protein [Leptospira selangorensis]TGM23595.1 hypothetical protein EHQ82_05345 [Leptospira selangorensis]